MKILYLNTYDSSFLHNQIVDIKKIGNVDVHFCVCMNLRDFIVLCSMKRKNIFSKSQDRSIKKTEISSIIYPNLPKNFSEGFDSYITTNILAIKFFNTKFDLIHAQNGYPSGHVAYLLSKKWNIPYIVTSHGQDTYRCFKNSIEMGGGIPFNRRSLKLFKIAIRNADLVLGVSKLFAKKMNEICTDVKIDYVSNSYNYEIFKKHKNGADKIDYGFAKDDFIIIATGYFIERKSHIDILLAVSMLKDKRVKIVLIGGGPLEKYLLNKAKEFGILDQVKLINFISQKELVDWYNISDITVFPSLYEPFGLGLLEAMACGLPAIATKTWGPKEMIVDNVNGFLVDKHSPKQIASKIRFFLDSKSDLDRMSKESAEIAFKNYFNKNYELFQKYLKVVKEYEWKKKF